MASSIVFCVNMTYKIM